MIVVRKYFGVLVLHLLISFNNFNEISSFGNLELEVGDKCTWKGKAGTCVLLGNCKPLTDDLVANKIKLMDLLWCGFEGNDVIVCCVDPSITTAGALTTTTTTSRYTNVLFPGSRPNNDKNNPTNLIEINPPVTTVSPPATTVVNKRRAEIECDKIRKQFPGNRIVQKIVDGKNADFAEFPHMVALGYGSNVSPEWNCAGTLISDRFVLTAGHCTKSKQTVPVMARMGRNNIMEIEINDIDGIDVQIGPISLHKSYRQSLSYNDISLIQLAEPVVFKDGLHPACLYTNLADLDPSLNLTITGWGATNVRTRARSAMLQKAIVKPIPYELCSAIPLLQGHRNLPRGITTDQLCAWDNTSDTCQGDSGGPIQLDHPAFVATVVGVTSFGISCGSSTPGVYTKVASYLDWIESIVWPEEN